MVNNAGISVESTNPNPVHTTKQEAWDTTMRVNATSVFLGSKFAIRQMLEQQPHASGDRGWIINISSIFGLVGGYDARTFPLLARQETILKPLSVNAETKFWM